MLPTSKSHRSPTLLVRPPSAPARPRGRTRACEPLVPIGRERLQALKDAIERGTYPSDEDVVAGLTRLFSEEA